MVQERKRESRETSLGKSPSLRRLASPGLAATVAFNPWAGIDGFENDPIFRVCVDAMVEGLVLQDARGHVRFVNRSAEQILGASAEQFQAGLNPSIFQDIVDENGRGVEAGRDPLTQALRSGTALKGAVLGVRRPDGELRWLQINTQPVFDESGARPTAAISTFVDITSHKDAERRVSEQLDEIRSLNAMMKLQMRDLEKANEQLETLATHDGLTGLKNHRAFHERLESEVRRAKRYHTPLSVILLDVDRFKQYNDDFGHPAGDAVLRHIAELLVDNSRDSDLVARSGRVRGECTIARHGGEEFALILPHSDTKAASKAAERLRVAIEQADWTHRPVTASFGIASFNADVRDPAALIDAADSALYRSKKRGRNRVTCAGLRSPR